MFSWIATKLAGLAAGKIFNWKWVAAGVGTGVVVIAFLYLLWDRAELKAEYAKLQTYNVALQAANDSHLKTIDAMTRENAKGQAALLEREQQHQQIMSENGKYRRLLKEAYRNDETARNWANQSVPASVLNGLFD